MNTEHTEIMVIGAGYPADEPRWPYVGGSVGYHTRELLANFASALPRLERRLKLLYVTGKRRYTDSKRKSARLEQIEQL